MVAVVNSPVELLPWQRWLKRVAYLLLTLLTALVTPRRWTQRQILSLSETQASSLRKNSTVMANLEKPRLS